MLKRNWTIKERWHGELILAENERDEILLAVSLLNTKLQDFPILNTA